MDKIILPYNYKPRDYQLNFLKALDSGIKRAAWTVHRRGGKDLTTWNWVIKELNRKKQICYYILPTYSQAKKIIWDGMTKEGNKFLDFIPRELIKKKLDSELIIHFTNGSTLQLIGSEHYDRIVGTNPSICVFSEFALQNPIAWEYIRPILAENNGTAIFISTPRGKNHFFEIMQTAIKSDEWFGEILSVNDTKAISENAIAHERKSGMSDELIDQEFYCSFEIGQLGSIYGKSLKEVVDSNRLCNLPYDEDLLVYTAWDLGFSDETVIIFFQVKGKEIHIIDHYENHGWQLSHYIKVLESKKYRYGTHFIPHDGRQHTVASDSFYNKFRQTGHNVEVIKENILVMEGIEKVRAQFKNIYIDKTKCDQLYRCLLEYHYEFDQKAKIFRNKPHHNYASHSADALRYLILALDQIGLSNRMNIEDLRNMKRKYLGDF